MNHQSQIELICADCGIVMGDKDKQERLMGLATVLRNGRFIKIPINQIRVQFWCHVCDEVVATFIEVEVETEEAIRLGLENDS